MTEQVFPLYFPFVQNESNNDLTIIVSEVETTTIKFAFGVVEQNNVVISHNANYNVKNFSSFAEAYNVFIKEHQLENPNRISIAVAAPVIQNKSTSDKLHFSLDAHQIKSELNVEHVSLINDLEAAAYGLVTVGRGQLLSIYDGDSTMKGNVAILSPGKGLGEAGLFWDGANLRPFATEGGHSEFSPRTDWEVSFYQFLKKIYSIVSWETVLSEEGLFNIYRFLRDVKQHEEPDWLTARFETEDKYAVIIDVALKKEARICTVALDYFSEFMAREANNLVLKLKATGGLILTGEIPALMYEVLNKEKFYKDFIISDKMEKILKDIPIYILLDPQLNLTGAAYYGAFAKE